MNFFERRSKVRMGEEPFFVNFNNSRKHPRQESFSEMIYISCFPQLKILSLTFLIFLIDISVFIYCFYYAGIKYGSEELFTPKQKALFDLGMNYPYFTIVQAQVERIVGCLFLFANLKHLLVSVLCLLIFGSYSEHLLGFKKTFLVFVVGGYGGELLSCLMSDQPSVMGSNSPATFIGIIFGFLITQWEKWDYPGSGRTQMLFVILFGIASIFTVGVAFPLADVQAMGGAMIIGVLFIFGVYRDDSKLQYSISPTHSENSKFSRFLSLFLIAFFLIGGTFAVLFMRTPSLL